MACSEFLISLVYSKPEIWDQSHIDYSSKNLKVKAWTFIADKLGVTADVAKGRWTNLRDLFRRELKKTLRLAEESGDPDAHKPRWKHFRSMLFLKDQMVKDEGTSSSASLLQFEEQYTSSLYPQTILEDGDGVKYEEDVFLEEAAESSPGSTPSHYHPEQSSRPKKRRSTDVRPLKVPRWSNEVFADPHAGVGTALVGIDETWDEDYHFVMSILPSIRRIRRERKMCFRMKVLQLIVDEENLEAAA